MLLSYDCVIGYYKEIAGLFLLLSTIDVVCYFLLLVINSYVMVEILFDHCCAIGAKLKRRFSLCKVNKFCFLALPPL